MDKVMLNIMIWVLFLGGLFGGVVGMVKFFTNGTPAEYGVMGIGGGFWLLAAGIIMFLRKKFDASFPVDHICCGGSL